MLLVWIVLLATAGCGSHPHLTPTPTVYTRPDWNPFDGVPPALQGNRLPVLCITGRAPENDSPDHRAYGTRRSRSAAFGVCDIQIGPDDLSWDKLVAASRTAKRA